MTETIMIGIMPQEKIRERILAIAREPRIASASSRVIGCPARLRRAKSTASVLVCMP